MLTLEEMGIVMTAMLAMFLAAVQYVTRDRRKKKKNKSPSVLRRWWAAWRAVSVSNRVRKRLRAWKGFRHMSRKAKKEREVAVKTMTSDLITSAFEDAVYAGKMTREEANKYYNMFARRCFLPDLLPQKIAPHPLVVKSDIIDRRANGLYPRDKEGKVIPVKIPGDQPPPITRNSFDTLGDILLKP